MSTFCRTDNDDILNRNYYYVGYPIVPDAPLNGIMSLQIQLSMSFDKEYCSAGLQSYVRTLSRASGNHREANKMMKRLCKFQARKPVFVDRMYAEWANLRNITNFQNWLKGLRPEYREKILSACLEGTRIINEVFLQNNLGKWALSD